MPDGGQNSTFFGVKRPAAMWRNKFFGGTKRNKVEQCEWPKVFGIVRREMCKWRGVSGRETRWRAGEERTRVPNPSQRGDANFMSGRIGVLSFCCGIQKGNGPRKKDRHGTTCVVLSSNGFVRSRFKSGRTDQFAFASGLLPGANSKEKYMK